MMGEDVSPVVPYETLLDQYNASQRKINEFISVISEKDKIICDFNTRFSLMQSLLDMLLAVLSTQHVSDGHNLIQLINDDERIKKNSNDGDRRQ